MTGGLPLAGVRVLDLSRVLAGPLCAQVLGDFGAEVIKIEHPRRGDDTRDWGLRVGQTETAYFNSMNRNKRSVTVDLASAEGQALVLELAKQCDVVVQNFKFGGAEKMGLGYEQVKAVRPDVIYCSVSGYDRHGEEATRPGYDLVIQGEAGLMALNGEPTQPPLKFGVAAVDMFTGMYAAQAILAALFDRQRTGAGRHVEMALFDCGLMISAYYGLEALLLQKDPPRYGNAHPSIVPYGVFDAQDGPLIVAVGNNAQFERFCNDVIERPDILADERYRTNLVRGQNRDTLVPLLLAEMRARPRKLLLQRMSAVGIPCGEVLGLHEALTSPRAQSAGLVTKQPHPVAGSMDVMAPPYRMDGERLPVRLPPPVLGEGTREVLAGLLGYDDDRLAALEAHGVIRKH
jgi:crotonobetainyl-CoA:carnitine CoA-transferase CaiB-like acyl-CoA transferase